MLDTPCREYQGQRNNNGYGVRHGLARKRFGTAFVHRQVMIMAGHNIAGKKVLHRCDNPACFRYDHLRVGTQSENMQECSERGRLNNANVKKTHCPKGHPYLPGNEYRRKGTKRTYRVCRICIAQRKKDRHGR